MSVPKRENEPTVANDVKKKPVIEAGDIHLTVGTKCDLLVGVSATDWKGRDISRNIHILGEENLDMNKEGVYFIDYWVMDDRGVFAKKSIKVIIE